MTGGLYYTYLDFVTNIRMSNDSFILVEGSGDKNFFETLQWNARIEQRSMPCAAVVSAEIIRSDHSGDGNRTKVERICELIEGEPFAYRLVGFVDREFRSFRFGPSIEDDLKAQRDVGRLVWSRGHSIENYFFELDTAVHPLYACTPTASVAESSLDLLRANFARIMNIACAIGLAANDINQLQNVRGSIDVAPFTVRDSTIDWEIDKWKTRLTNTPLPSHLIGALVDRYEHWLEVSRRSDAENVRWSCDGHIGLKMIWSAYAAFVFETRQRSDVPGPNASNQRSAVLSVREQVRFNQMAINWARIYSVDGLETPWLCFDKIRADN